MPIGLLKHPLLFLLHCFCICCFMTSKSQDCIDIRVPVYMIELSFFGNLVKNFITNHFKGHCNIWFLNVMFPVADFIILLINVE